jgi:hypothetical protein
MCVYTGPDVRQRRYIGVVKIFENQVLNGVVFWLGWLDVDLTASSSQFSHHGVG